MLELSADTQVDLRGSGVRHGWGLFETIRVQAGEPRWLELHLERLAGGCAFLGLPSPPRVATVRAFLSTHGECARVGQGVLRLIAADNFLRVFVEPLPSALPASVGLGRSLETVRFSGNPLNRFKTLSYMENLRLAEEARSRGLFEVLALNERGHLCDGGRTSVFVVLGGKAWTPPGGDGALPGVARRVLLEAGLAAEATLTWSDVEGAEGIFLVNALRGVIPVDRVEEGRLLERAHPQVLRAAGLLI